MIFCHFPYGPFSFSDFRSPGPSYRSPPLATYLFFSILPCYLFCTVLVLVFFSGGIEVVYNGIDLYPARHSTNWQSRISPRRVRIRSYPIRSIQIPQTGPEQNLISSSLMTTLLQRNHRRLTQLQSLTPLQLPIQIRNPQTNQVPDHSDVANPVLEGPPEPSFLTFQLGRSSDFSSSYFGGVFYIKESSVASYINSAVYLSYPNALSSKWRFNRREILSIDYTYRVPFEPILNVTRVRVSYMVVQ